MEILGKIKAIWEESGKAYGVRKVWAELRNEGHGANYKRVARIMRKFRMRGAARKRKARYSSYEGTVGKVADNVLKRDFSADAPNQKWTTDVTEFACPFGKACLSPIKDTFDSSIAAWDLSLHPSFSRTVRMLEAAFEKNPHLEGLIFHSDQGWQYQSALRERGMIQTMSRKGNCLDNSVMESFFGTMKAEMFVGHESEFRTFVDLYRAVKRYIDWYNSGRIMEKTKWMPPLAYREASICGFVQ